MAFSSLDTSVGDFQQAGALMALSDLSLPGSTVHNAPMRAGRLFCITAVAQVGDADGTEAAGCCGASQISQFPQWGSI